ncbi:5-methylcytosine-specific restriction protein A [Streptomyces sp. PvR006]|uniref:HNH endonuclease n=1 Tax=Streptomyces sp. PvR006 TaxID=2817860 RepID=UPI001AE376EC|nr:HNH endonuclease [Streptomyces sp. PvR006]MBP2582394.1 5-methylcytosine-specific restriction protein A [Streptomyces sp. PvR006]
MGQISWVRDELLLACALVMENGWQELRQNDVRVLELSGLLRSLPLHENAAADSRFRSRNSVSRKTTDIATAHPDHTGGATKGGRPTQSIVADFLADPEGMLAAAQALRAGIASGELHSTPAQPDEVDEDGESTAREGRLLVRLALHRERDRSLRNRKIQQVRRLNEPIRCAACAFDFGVAYGPLGTDYIEVHHITPLHVVGPSKTRLEDLALLCANCHRMCHRNYAGEAWRTPEDLREKMRAASSAS